MNRAQQSPWEALPPEVATALRPELPALADEIIAAIAEEVPGYALPLKGAFGRGLRLGVEQALEQFVRMVERPGEGRESGREVYVGLGRGEVRAGRSLDALQAAYRLGARVAWRRLAAVGVEAGLDPNTLYLLAESIFAYIDELAAESTEGYALEQAAAAGELQRRRRELVRLLVQEPAADEAAIADAAARAGWALPRTLAALVTDGEDADRLAARLGAGAIAAPLDPELCALVPDPDAPGRRGELEAALGDGRAALGPTVGWREAAVSAGRARCSPAGGGGRRSAPGLDRRRRSCGLAAARARPPAGPGPRRRPPRPPRGADAGGARAARRDSARLARPPGADGGGREGAERSPPDGALPARPPARALRRGARAAAVALRARGCAAGRRLGSRARPAIFGRWRRGPPRARWARPRP